MKTLLMKIAFLLVIMLTALAACGRRRESEAPEGSFAADAALIVETVEEVHPIFLMPEMLPDTYEAARAGLLGICADASAQEFVFAVRRYFATLQDGHMSMSGRRGGIYVPEVGPIIFNDFLDVEWDVRFVDGYALLFLSDNETVLDIGGVLLCTIFEVINTYNFFENSSDQKQAYALFARYGTILEIAGVDISGGQVDLTVLDHSNGETRTQYAPLNMNWWDVNTAFDLDFIIRHEIIDDVFFIDLRAFFDEPGIADTETAIRAAIADGIRKFIVDLRGNTGGCSSVGVRLLHAMGAQPPAYGVLRRLSPIVDGQQGLGSSVDQERGYIFAHPFPWLAFNRHDVFISVLTDVNTYSTATMFGVWVQDGNLGNIIGHPSRNSPNCFGAMFSFDLPYSGFTARVSLSRFQRPDRNACPFYLQPDILVCPSEALYVALANFGVAE